MNSHDLGVDSVLGVHNSLALSIIPIITQNSISRMDKIKRNIKKASKFIVKCTIDGCFTHNRN